MSIYVIPALIALLLKLGVYVLAKKDSVSLEFMWLLLFFAVQNLIEFLVMSAVSYGHFSTMSLKLYYVSALLVFAYMCVFAMSVGNESDGKLFNISIITLSLSICAIVFFTDLIVSGVRSIGYSITAIKGSLYFLFQGFVLFCFVFLITILVSRFNRSNDMRVRLKCFYVIFALLPFVVLSVVVIVAMQMGVKLNAVMVFPLASTCFLLLVVLSERNHDLINIRHRLLFSKARMAEKRVLEIVREHLHDGVDLPKAKFEFEKALVKYALDDSDGNIAWAADRLNVNRSSLYSMLDRLGIQRNDSAAIK